MATFLKGGRVRLRPLESDEDIKYLFRSFNDPQAMGEHVNFEARSWDAFQSWLREMAKPPIELTFFLVVRNEDNKTIGSVIHFIPSPISKSCLEIGYGIDELSLREKGYASEAVRLLIDYLFSTKTVQRVQATTTLQNIPSQRLLEKLGFTNEGTLRDSDFINGKFVDALIYSILREEWGKTRV